MARYIDADRLIADGWRLERHGISNKLLQVMSIADVPTADVVEVVRCKDCKYYKVGNPNADYCYHERYEDLSQSASYKPDDFCSYGTPKERGGEE